MQTIERRSDREEAQDDVLLAIDDLRLCFTELPPTGDVRATIEWTRRARERKQAANAAVKALTLAIARDMGVKLPTGKETV
jgi:hypothetical protein